jgi:hypothetical protein
MNESTKIIIFKFSLLKLFLILAVLLGGIYFAYRSGANSHQYKNDFNVYYFAASEILDGRTPYDNSLGAWTPYLYPPLLAELLAPLTLLPLPVAAYLWFLLNAFSLFVALRMSARLACPEAQKFESLTASESAGMGRFRPKMELQTFASVITLVVLLRFVLDNFDYGQVNIIVVALAVAHVYFYSKDKKLASAIVFVFAVSIKITPVVFLFYHLAKGRVKYVTACAALLVAVTALSFAPFALRAPEAFHTFVNRTINNEQGFNFADHGNQSLRAAIERIKGNAETTDPASVTMMITGLAFLALALFVAFKAKNETLAVAPFFCLSVLISPLSWKQHFVILILPITFLVSQALRQVEPPVKKLLFVTIFVVFALFNLTSPKIIGIAAAEWCESHSLVFLGALMIFLVLNALSFKLPQRALKKTI